MLQCQKGYKMKQDFINATQKLQIINDNKKLTIDNYSKSSTEKLGKKIWSILSSYIAKNISLYQNLTKQDYNTKQKYVIDILNLLLSEFPNTAKPKIYFKEDIDKIINNCTDENLKHKIKQYTNVSAMFYSPLLNYYAKDMIKSVIGTEEPFFMFYNGLSVEPDILGLIVHEFTHYLQSIGQSSIPQQTIQKACEYYKYIYADATLSKQLHDDSIHEVEARDMAKYINEQTKLMQKTIISSNDYTK